MTLIPAAPGWRVCVWSREQDSAIALHIVAWEPADSHRDAWPRPYLRPYVLTAFGEAVQPLRDSDWFVAIMPPEADLVDYLEAAANVAEAERRLEERS